MSATTTPVATAPEERNTEAAEAAVEAITGAANQEATFSLALSQDQKDIRDWVHGFAADVDAPRRARVGRAGGDPLADHPGGRQDRPLRLRGPRAVLRRPDRPDACRSSTRSCSGATPASAWRSWAPRSPSPRSSARARGEQIGEWIPHCFGTAGRRQGRRVLRLRAQRRLRRLRRAHPRQVRRGRRTSGCSTARRRGPPTAASPTSTSSSPPSTPSSARAATPRSSCR